MPSVANVQCERCLLWRQKIIMCFVKDRVLSSDMLSFGVQKTAFRNVKYRLSQNKKGAPYFRRAPFAYEKEFD